jgi:hypothetical protein
LGAGIGFVPGFMSWNTLYSLNVADAPVIWIPAYFGYGGALLFQLGLLFLAAAWVWRGFAGCATAPERENSASPMPSSLRRTLRRLWEGRWPYWTGGLIIGLIGVFAIIRMKPLGMTGSLGSVARALAWRKNWIPEKLHGLDGFAGCASLPQDSWLTPENLLLAGLVGGAFVASLASAQFTLQKPQWSQAARGLGGGILLGWGAMTGLGCTIGTLLSGAQAGAVSGWVFGMTMFVAIWGGLKIKRRYA